MPWVCARFWDMYVEMHIYESELEKKVMQSIQLCHNGPPGHALPL